MKKKDIFQMIDKIDETKKREECTVYRNTIESVFSLPENEQLSVFRAIFIYSFYGIDKNFVEFLTKNRQKLTKNRLKITSFESIFSLLKKQRIGWEMATKSANNNQIPYVGALGGYPQEVPIDQVYKNKDIKTKDIKDKGKGKEETYNEEMERVKREMEEERRRRNEQ